MTAWERFIGAARGDSLDHAPLAMIGTARYFASEADVSLSELYYDPSAMMDAERAVMERYPQVVFLPGFWPDYGLGFLSAFGLKIEWPDGACSATRDARYGSFSEIRAMEDPDPRRDGVWPWYIRTLRRCRERYSSNPERLKCLWAMGPGEIAGYLMGLTGFLEALASEPGAAHAALSKITRIVISWLGAQREVLADAEAILLTDDIAGLLSPRMYEEILLPYHQSIRASFPDLLIIYHNDADSNHLFEGILKTGFDVFQMGSSTSLSAAYKTFGSKMSLMGNIDTVRKLENGSVKDVMDDAQRCFHEVGGSSRFILGPSGGLNTRIGKDKMDALLRCCGR